jgi:hypothetical protein
MRGIRKKIRESKSRMLTTKMQPMLYPEKKYLREIPVPVKENMCFVEHKFSIDIMCSGKRIPLIKT